MSRSLALLFAIISVALFCGVSLSIVYRSAWGIVLCSLGAVAFMGYGFALNARLQRKKQG